MTTPDKLFYTAVLSGRVNDQELSLHGSGIIDTSIGLTQGTYDLLAVPIDLHPSFLSASLITGYPNACACDVGVENTFVGKSYSYTRRFSGAEDIDLVLQAECKLEGNQLRSLFSLNGTLKTGILDTMEPLVESWSPTTDILRGHFVASWKRAEATPLTVTADSEYRIDGGGKQIDLLHRYIEVQSKLEAQLLTLNQRVRLFHRM